ncbi:hypothetical protein BC829DRAFT_489736 [Chytridium lagenaria]|nr:hypothetical protein BC829DRAFT_489736 [Chytridium lagenaria]
MAMVYSLLALTVALAFLAPEVSTAPQKDPCSVLKSDSVFVAKDVLPCLRQFKISIKDRADQVKAIKGYMNIYPYLNLKLTDNINVMKSLDSIRDDAKLTTEMDFQIKISQLFLSLRDAHTTYSPACFNNIYYLQPFKIGAEYDPANPTKQPKIVVRGSIADGSSLDFEGQKYDKKVLDLFRKEINLEPAKYKGWEITEIDGKNALTAVRQYADEFIGIGRDPEMRFNLALAQAGYRDGKIVETDGTFYFLKTFPWGFKTDRTYKLVNPAKPNDKPVIVKAPWVGIWRYPTPTGVLSEKKDAFERAEEAGENGALGSKIDVLDENNEESTTDTVDILAKRSDGEEGQVEKGDESALGFETRFVIPKQLKPTVSDKYSAFYVLPDNTGVFKLTTFEFDKDRTNIRRKWVPTIVQGLKSLADLKVKRLIIDVSGNTGGTICIGKALTKLLVPSADFVRFDIRLSEANAFLMKYAKAIPIKESNVFTLDSSFIETTQTLKSKDPYSILLKNNTNQIKRGTITETFSGPFHIGCAEVDAIFGSLKVPWKTSDIVVVGNGLCGSTCAMTGRALREQGKIKFYTYGGYNGGKPFQPTAFEGGSVLQLGAILDSTRAIRKVMVKEKATSYSSHGGNVKTPDEYIKHPADGHVVVKDVTDLATIWQRVAAIMKKPVKQRVNEEDGWDEGDVGGDSDESKETADRHNGKKEYSLEDEKKGDPARWGL